MLLGRTDRNESDLAVTTLGEVGQLRPCRIRPPSNHHMTPSLGAGIPSADPRAARPYMSIETRDARFRVVRVRPPHKREVPGFCALAFENVHSEFASVATRPVSGRVWFNARMAMDEVTTWSACEIAHVIVWREVSSDEVVQAHLQRIGTDDTNSVVTLSPHAVDDACRALMPSSHAASWCGLLHGVPFTVKDVIDTAGLRTTAGSELFRDCVPPVDAGAVAAFRAAGAILLGKTNCPEFALEPQTAYRFGTTRNPHDARLGPGGSSGGCGAAVAAGLTPLSLGLDYGGSVRFPAHCTESNSFAQVRASDRTAAFVAA